MKPVFASLVISLAVCTAAQAQSLKKFQSDTVKTSSGDLVISFIGHGSLAFTFKEKMIYVDPWGELADYSKLPKADLILVTHEHYDHLDKKAIEASRKKDCVVLASPLAAKALRGATVMKNGSAKTVLGVKIEAVPAYNIKHLRDGKNPFHPKGDGNGYVLTFGNTRVYVAGDTENIPEMKRLRGVDIAFLPMNLPYTMTPQMVADAAKMIMPKALYPYHYGDTDTKKLAALLKDAKGIEIRIRRMK